MTDSSEFSDLEHIRKRPSMYVFSTGPVGLGLLAGELVSNSIDQFLASRAKSIQLRIEGRSITTDRILILNDTPEAKCALWISASLSGFADVVFVNFLRSLVPWGGFAFKFSQKSRFVLLIVGNGKQDRRFHSR